jgi:hypothetical protein
MATSRQESADLLRFRARRAVLFLALALALQWGGTDAERSGFLHVANPANSARLEPATPAEPFLAPRELATVAIGERRTPGLGPETDDDAGALPDPWIVADLIGAAAMPAVLRAAPSSLPASPYEARGPPRLG